MSVLLILELQKNTILYGLGAIKNVGSEAVSNLIKEKRKKWKI